jgi:transposase InsO family protein
MAWRETSPMEQRVDFIRDVRTGLFTMTELADTYGISRKTGYKWIDRYEADGIDGLRDRSRRPHCSPTAIDDDVIEQLVALRTHHPFWGPKKLLAVLACQQPEVAWPSCSTVSAVLKRDGLVAPRLSRRRRWQHAAPPPRSPITAPNDVWTTDFKGEFRTGDRAYCYPFTLRDGFSRFVLRCDALADCAYEATRDRFHRAFATYGLPQCIRSDNGNPFAGPGVARLSRLTVWWIRLGIVPERIAPGHPEQNGSHEQFHAVLKAETTRPPAANRHAQQRRFARFCHEYNHDRPHEALNNEPPVTRYTASPRSLPARLPPVDYPSHCDVRRVSHNGRVSWQGESFFLSKALIREDVAFEETDDGIWTVSFATIRLARYDERHRSFQLVGPQTSAGRSAADGSAPDFPKAKKR